MSPKKLFLSITSLRARKTSKSLLVSLLILFLPVTINQVVYATSEAFPLSPGTPTIRNVELQKNERLVGSFTITNLQTWENGAGDTQSYLVSVNILNPKGQVIWYNIYRESDFFVFTASYSGIYTISFLVYAYASPPSGLENPQATLNYNVVIPSQSDNSPSGNLPNWIIPTLLVGIISIVVALTTYYAVNKRGKASH
jgi:hypothetical protein